MFKYISIMLLCLGGCATPIEGQELNKLPNQEVIPVPPVVQPKMPVLPNAPRPHGQIFTAHKPMQCNDTDVIENYIKNKFGQVPFTWGLNYNPMGAPNLMTIIYINPMTRTFSVVEHNVHKVSCIVNTGESFGYMDDTLLQGGRLN